MKAQLEIDGQRPLLLVQPRYLIGRGDGCDLLLPEDDAGVSRRHSLMESDSHGVWNIVDLGSRNGTLVNGQRLSDKRMLIDGDRITIGRSQMTLSQPRSQPTVAAVSPFLQEPPAALPAIQPSERQPSERQPAISVERPAEPVMPTVPVMPPPQVFPALSPNVEIIHHSSPRVDHPRPSIDLSPPNFLVEVPVPHSSAEPSRSMEANSQAEVGFAAALPVQTRTAPLTPVVFQPDQPASSTPKAALQTEEPPQAFSLPAYMPSVSMPAAHSAPVYSPPVQSLPVYSPPVQSLPVQSLPSYSQPALSRPGYAMAGVCGSCGIAKAPGMRWCTACHTHTLNPAFGRVAAPGKRLGAAFMDNIIPGSILGFLVIASALTGPFGIIFLLGMFAFAGWSLYLFCSGTTPGKKALGLTVIKEDGTRAGFGTMLVREWIGKWLSGMVFSLGYLWILFDKDRQAWHDKLVSTYVVDNRTVDRG